MHKIPFKLKELAIQKMPGLPGGLNDLKNLSPYINIIAGPNASGKSSTARLIQQLIRRKSTDGLHARSIVEIDQENWQINIDSKHISVQREGADAQLTGLPPAEAQERYMLAFHELVNKDDQDLAQQIIRESVGGYDIEQARQHLNYSEKIANRSVSEYKNYEEAQKAYKRILQQQKNLESEQQELAALYRKQKLAREAIKRKEFYQLVQNWMEQKQEFEHWKNRYEAFPAEMEKVNGEELKQIDELENEINQSRKAMEQARRKIEACNKNLAELKVPQSGINETVLEELEITIGQIEETERAFHEKSREVAKAKKEEEEILNDIGTSLNPEEWKGVDLEEVSNLQEFLEKATKVYSEQQYLETELEKLNQEREESTDDDPDKLKEGIKTLGSWLKNNRASGISGKWLWLLTAAGAVTAVLTHFLGAFGLFGLVLVAVLLYLGFNETTGSEVTIRKQDYLDTGLEEPNEWSPEQVAETLDWLSKRLAGAQYRDKIYQKIEQYSEELRKLKAEVNEINTARQEWKDKLKAAPELPSGSVRNYSGLYYFLKNLKEWQQKHRATEALKAEHKKLEENHSQLLSRINDLFQHYTDNHVNDAAKAKAVFKNLKNEEYERRENIKEIERQNEQIKHHESQVEEKKEKWRQIYRKLNLEEGEREKLRSLLEKLDEYNEVKQNYHIQKDRLREKGDLMTNHSLYTTCQEEINELTPDQVKEYISENEALANQLEEVNEQITRIETNINTAKQKSDLENALKHKEQKLSELNDLYQSNLASITGNLLVDQLKEETHEQNQTPVFKRANELFNRITRGRYQLRLEEKETPVFKAFDTLLNEGQHLNVLSTGTRIQLLLAVRLAFIETQEPALKLPILADELLANSDEARAEAIIEALVEISKEGRQVFYFTAQADEVAKWKTYLEPVQDISYKIFEISGENREAFAYEEHDASFRNFRLEQTDILSPQGMSHDEYGKKLQVPSFNLLTHKIGQLHIWYLLEDPNLIYNSLKQGIKYWGQLKSFLENGGKIEGFDENTLQKIKDKARLLERFQQLYKQGRAVPINREVLENSGAVSDTFIDAVDNKLKAKNNNPERLIRALRNREVPRFMSDKTDDLKNYLLKEGYISEETPLDKNEIKENIQRLLSNMNIGAAEAERLIERVVND
jgi:DNA repair exonuclease SbcCD ATPase subunit